MGVLHDRALLNRFPAPLLAPVLVLSLMAACGGGSDAPEPAAVPADTLTVPATGPSLDPVPAGDPMPPAAEAGGIPPYPRAVVHVRVPRDNPDMRSFEAFTPDDYATVVAFYDSALAGWSKTRDQDVVIYDAGEDRAALTVSVWEREQLPEGSPEALTTARTAIGAAWRP